MTKVTVLGAGAAGLAVAAQLKAAGVDCAVLERGPGVATSWRGRVVGPGNSGAEIATDLAEGGAASVSLAIRTPPHIIRRETAGWPAQMNGILLSRLPERLFNTMAAAAARAEMPDLRPYGIDRPSEGLKTRLRTSRYVPLQDVGIVRDIMAGRVRPVAAVQAFTETSVLLADGTTAQPDAVIAATGYGTGLRDLFDDPSLIDETGVPLVHGGAAARPGLYFMGYDVTLGGMLRQAAIEARRVARTIRKHTA